MKKITSLILLTALLFSLAGCQGESESRDESGVALRKGYYWLMPMEEILTLAEEEGLVMTSEVHEYYADFSDVPFGPFTAPAMWIFAGVESGKIKGLLEVQYRFGPFPEDEAEQCESLFLEIENYLTSVYGELTERVDEQKIPWIQETRWKLDDTVIKLRIIAPKSVAGTFCIVLFESPDAAQNSN